MCISPWIGKAILALNGLFAKSMLYNYDGSVLSKKLAIIYEEEPQPVMVTL